MFIQLGAQEEEEHHIEYVELLNHNAHEPLKLVKINVLKHKLQIWSVYRPPSFNVNEFINTIDCLMYEIRKDDLILGNMSINLMEGDRELTKKNM